jgi:hypothetical protein
MVRFPVMIIGIHLPSGIRRPLWVGMTRGLFAPSHATCSRQAGLPQVLGSCGYGHWWAWVVGWSEPLSKIGTESAI